MKYVWLIILICLISVVSGCASTISNSEFKEQLVSNQTVVLIQLYDNVEDVERVCGEGTVGCAPCNKQHTICKVHSIKERECLGHEIDHVLFGPFHEDMPSTCTVRAK